MILNLMYGVLQTISQAIYTTVVSLWQIEKALISLMMSTFLFLLGLVCHPIMVIPMLMGGFYVLRNIFFQRCKVQRQDDSTENDNGLAAGIHSMTHTPRIRFYRSIENPKLRSCDFDN
ncbi:hypothetical protein KR009_006591 [Drosophila setifemur]|nr:hypothetical protein KR009_006591 [Drosophila setifemur]